MKKYGKGKMAAIIITVILVAAIIGVSSWLIAVRAKSGKYNLIKVKNRVSLMLFRAIPKNTTSKSTV